MSLLSEILYRLRWGWFAFRIIGYRHYRFMVFLSRPFAPHCLSSFCFGLVMLTHYYTSGWPQISNTNGFQQNAENLFIWLQYTEGKNLWKIIDVPLLMIGLFCQIPQIVFRRYTAIRGTMKKPLRPMRKVRPPKEKRFVAQAQIIVKSPKTNKQAETYEIPTQVQALLENPTL